MGHASCAKINVAHELGRGAKLLTSASNHGEILRAYLFWLPESFRPASAFEPSKSQKAPGSQNAEAHYSKLLGFWLMGAVWLL